MPVMDKVAYLRMSRRISIADKEPGETIVKPGGVNIVCVIAPKSYLSHPLPFKNKV